MNDDDCVFIVKVRDGTSAPPDYAIFAFEADARECTRDSHVIEAEIYKAVLIETVDRTSERR